MKTTSKSLRAFTLVEIMIVVAIISLLAVIAIPNFVRARTTSQRNACINNLRQLHSVKQQWALECKKSTTDSPSLDDVTTYLKNPLICPSDGANGSFNSSYSMENVGTRPTCKIVPDKHLLFNDDVSE